MLPKIAHYAGFQSYGDLSYPDLKPGKKELESNTIFQETVRKGDELKFYNNSNRWQTVYEEDISKGVVPVDFVDPLRVTKQQVEKTVLSTDGTMKITGGTVPPQRRTFTSSFPAEGNQFHQKGVDLYNKTLTTLKRNDQEDVIDAELRKTANSASPKPHNVEEANDYDYLQTGTEHWKSSYNAAIKDPYAITSAKRPDWSLHKPAYTVQGAPRASNYKENFGERGTNPRDKVDALSLASKTQEELMLGTTKSTFHVPGYTGHIPKSLPSPDNWEQAVGTNTRTTYLKQNVTENYHTRIPGYSGHRPTEAINDRGVPRQYCFSTVGERFH